VASKKSGPHLSGIERLKELVKLLDNPTFIADSRAYWDAYKVHSEKIGPNKLEFDRQAQGFMDEYLEPFMKKWKGAYPASLDLLTPPLFQAANAAIANGRWGIIPVYPWTTEKDVTQHRRKIKRAIGREDLDFSAIRRAQIARWLEEFYISPRTNAPPERRKLAEVVWARKSGLERPTLEEAIADLPEQREREWLRHYQTMGKSRREAEKLVYKNARGKESRASAMVRVAINRQRTKRIDLSTVIMDPNKTDKLGLAITLILRDVSIANPSIGQLEGIRSKVIHLGELLLPLDSPSKKAN